ncbi:chromate efflux transporter [Methylorubrum podarium]|jgi:chromate transporter|uniref:chromate efflux transporter n=1 Tax=Methylorubrum podarium TaxID=200476 RepID=UPI001EE1B6EB|nr:chromate efflux transporter [Methylorubrum podarium]GJE71736.1 Chromate transport protein [Methylorubrum podarium]
MKADVQGVSSAEDQSVVPQLSYAQIFAKFLRFGFLAWGGPVAQIAMIRRELVEEERWVSGPRFNRLLAVYQVLPGPEAHELCVFFGTLPKGRLGGLLAGLGFMLPGFVLMFALSWLYLSTNITQTVAAAAFLGVQPAVIALIVRAVHRIGGHVLLDRWLWGIAAVAGFAALVGTPFWITLPLAGLAYVFAARHQLLPAGLLVAMLIGLGLYFAWTMFGGPTSGSGAVAQAVAEQKPSLLQLFFSGLKAGLLTFGGAYTVIPFLRDDAVGNGWMTDAQFLDGLALSGILPAPLIIFSTFVGYFGGGPLGAIVMTIGIFLPAFGFSLFFHDQLERLVDNEKIRTFLEGVSAGVVGLIAATTFELGYKTLVNVPGVLIPLAIFATSLAALYVFKAKTTILWVVLAAAAAGLVLFR